MNLNSPDMPIETLTVRITGKVQGVGYRLATLRRAHLLGIGGWVRNVDDGSVEALIQGSPDQIDLMLQWLRVGPPAAQVHEVTSEIRHDDRRYGRFEQH